MALLLLCRVSLLKNGKETVSVGEEGEEVNSSTGNYAGSSIILHLEKVYIYIVLRRYRHRLSRTNQHRTGTDNYRYSNGQRLRVYWLYWVISSYI